VWSFLNFFFQVSRYRLGKAKKVPCRAEKSKRKNLLGGMGGPGSFPLVHNLAVTCRACSVAWAVPGWMAAQEEDAHSPHRRPLKTLA
jgi:hypothetical protein